MELVSPHVESVEKIPVTPFRRSLFRRGKLHVNVPVPAEHFLKLQLAAALKRTTMVAIVQEWIAPHLESLEVDPSVESDGDE